MRKTVNILIIGLLLALAVTARAQDKALEFRILAHRGCTADAPENSLGAVKAAIDLGIQGSEIDLRTTADGRIILMHDETLDRTTSGQGAVKELNLDEIKKFRLKTKDGQLTGESVPTLDEVLDLIRPHSTFELALDLKDVDVRELARKIEASGLMDRIFFAVPNPREVGMAREIKAVNPKLRISLGLESWWKIEDLPTFAIEALDADALFAPEWYFPKRGFIEAREAGVEIQVYLWGSENLADRARKAAAMGAGVISVDYPRLLLPLLKPQGQNKVNKTGN